MKLIFVLSLLAIYVCAIPAGVQARTPKGRLFNGDTAQKGQFPYQVFLRTFSKEYEHDDYPCSGIILSNYWVITTGNCIYNATETRVQAGTNFRATSDVNRVTITAHEFHIPNDFNGNVYTKNNIGLLKLRSPFTFNEYIQPIKISKEEIKEDAVLTVSGWGSIANNWQFSNTLQYIDQKVISESQCRTVLGKRFNEDIVCTRSTTSRLRQLCYGDEGNPLVIYNNSPKNSTLVGIASLPVGNCGNLAGSNSTASGFVKVHHFVNWIQNVTGLHL